MIMKELLDYILNTLINMDIKKILKNQYFLF